MSWHMDKKVDAALIRLLDELCVWERETGRGTRLLLVPDHDDEEVVYAVDGKPVVHLTAHLLTHQLDFIKTLISGGKQ